ncbi:MAG: pentapeptide repeat-containing protein, partial [Merismopedia sp. SIO2A8]|nr:pentapeptide repeat-containing protein [Merismopedia sp. SIO2A8]
MLHLILRPFLHALRRVAFCFALISLLALSHDVSPAHATQYDKVNLTAEDFSGQDLRGNSFVQTIFRKANLSGANLSEVSMFGANANLANLEGADLRYATLDSAQFRRANLKNANLEGAYAFRTNFEGADVEGA